MKPSNRREIKFDNTIKENVESWILLQLGQFSELMFERLALHAGYGVRYTGTQYVHGLLPSAKRNSRKSLPPPTGARKCSPDFQLYTEKRGEWVPFKTVEVKWRASERDAKNKDRWAWTGAEVWVLFTPDEIKACTPKNPKWDDIDLHIPDLCESHYDELRTRLSPLLESWRKHWPKGYFMEKD